MVIFYKSAKVLERDKDSLNNKVMEVKIHVEKKRSNSYFIPHTNIF